MIARSNKKKRFIFSPVIAVLFSLLLIPIHSLAGSNSDNISITSEELLYQTTETFESKSGLILPESTYFYGIEENNEIKLNSSNTYVSIPKEVVEVIKDVDSIPKGYEIYNDSNRSLDSEKEGASTQEDSLIEGQTEEENIEGTVSSEESKDNEQIYDEDKSKTDEEDQTKESNAESKEDHDSTVKEEESTSSTTEKESLNSSEEEREDTNKTISETRPENDTSKEPDANQNKEDQVKKETTLKKQNYESIARHNTNLWTGSSSNYFKTTKNVAVYDNRSGPLKKVGELPKGQVYPIEGDYGDWHKIQFGNISGYVRKSDTIPDKGDSLKNINTKYENQHYGFKALEDVSVYDNTSGSLEEFGVINQGFSSYSIATDYGKWWRIIFADRVGYVRKNEVEAQFNSNVDYFKAEENLAVYDNRDGKLKKVGELTKGQVYPRISDYGNWHKIQFNDIYGYVRKASTNPDNGSTLKNENHNYNNQNYGFKTVKDVPVYDNTSGSLVQFGSLDNDITYKVVSDYGNWWRIILADRVGYVRKSDVEAQFNSNVDYFKAEENLAVYDNRDGKLKKVGELTKGQVYPRISDYGNWHRIQFGNIYGYIRKTDTIPDNGSSIKNLNENFSNSDNKFTAKDQVIVYDNTGSSLSPFGKIDKGTIFPIATDYGDWWRVIFADRVGYVRKSDVDIYGVKETNYNLTLDEALAIQMNATPQTDNNYAYVSQAYIDENNRVTADVLNVRAGTGTRYDVVGQLTNGERVTILESVNGWYRIEFSHGQWVNASEEDVLYYLDPSNFRDDERQQFQFLDLARLSDATAGQLNDYLSGKGTLSGQGQAFIDAGVLYGINDVYLVSHAILETGHGTSTLASGVEYNGVTVYNMFGVGAFDECPIECGAKRAYEEGWTTPYKAIVGGASFIGNNYVKSGQNTLYKMRWNPEYMSDNGGFYHQYATDIGWASKQVYTMYNLYQDLGLTNVYLDVPVYNS
ncbi:hypothetical protein M948_05970 [Virgibacillus sp. CM-4]|uniref:SH3 domain-containing protein n=1 Tax=Virgibacillus sp. CM-4 TaxID=1354277 RepID=UPI0003886CA4|nr:SH3 domain-containing protein [Virgibacillus sp. CM-4]EQB38119.1 hypothetical protein M948_05970 [Virgibacillus sp. CM-4]